jgi:UDP-N-acetylmuramate: L-alanyl-gamma-D-glutamyl-meso-diaminopimelate ligase
VKDEPRNFHFLGICGTAMGSVAAALRDRGFTVTGSDENIYPPMSTFLESRGVSLNQGYKAENIPDDADIIVIGNAMKRGNPEVEAVLNRKLYYMSLPAVLRRFFLHGRHNLVVTGTHGKTTTTALLATAVKADSASAIAKVVSVFIVRKRTADGRGVNAARGGTFGQKSAQMRTRNLCR